MSCFYYLATDFPLRGLVIKCSSEVNKLRPRDPSVEYGLFQRAFHTVSHAAGTYL